LIQFLQLIVIHHGQSFSFPERVNKILLLLFISFSFCL
jgi:hypothetical protein